MPDEPDADEPDDSLLDLTKIKHDRTTKARESEQGAKKKTAPKRVGGRKLGPSLVRGEPDEHPAGPQQALNREQLVLDEKQAELDRGKADRAGRPAESGDRRKQDRYQIDLDRDQSALDRDQARVDRAQAALDREGNQRKDYLIDDLTRTLRRGPGLRELQHEMDRARREGDPLVVAFVDVDGLKAVNDEQGHAAGDQLLRDAADALKQGLRSYDLVLRYGGDEFVCALSNTEIDRAHGRLREVADILEASPSQGSIDWGVAQLQADDTLDDFVARADSSLYRARRVRRDLEK